MGSSSFSDWKNPSVYEIELEKTQILDSENKIVCFYQDSQSHAIMLEMEYRSGDDAYGIVLEYGDFESDSLPVYKKFCHYWEVNGQRYSKIQFKTFKEKAQGKPVKYEIRNPMPMSALLDKCWATKSWKKRHYDQALNSSQHFAQVVFEILGASKVN